MRVLGVNGSGRRGGNTGVLVEAFLAGARDAGAETRRFELADWELRGCTACKRCKQTHRCVIGDDMQAFYDVAPETDLLLLASPIYLDHITAQLMTFVQRTYCYLGADLSNHYPRRTARAVLGITYGAHGPEAYRYVLDWLAARLKGYYGIETAATFAIHSTQHEPVISPDHPEVARAREAARALVSA